MAAGRAPRICATLITTACYADISTSRTTFAAAAVDPLISASSTVTTVSTIQLYHHRACTDFTAARPLQISRATFRRYFPHS